MMRKDNKTSLAKNLFFFYSHPLLGDENMASEDDDTGN